MKPAFGFLIAMVLSLSTVAHALTIDGVADAAYGSAISTQQIGTVAGDNNYGNQGIANGSELDAAYAFVSNGVLYLVIAGNFNSLPVADGGTSPNDYLNIFFMTGAGGDHTLGTNYTATYNDRINNMGVGANGTDPSAPGLTFDTGFAANYWFGINVGYNEALDATNTMFVDYQVVCSNCPSAYLGSVTSTNVPPNILTNVYFGSTIQVSLNNANVAGVDGTPCYTNAVGAAQSVAAAAVTTGVELAIPLPVIGYPTGNVYICSFITDKYFQTMYNQVLGPVWDGTTTYCQSFLAGGSPAYVDFSALPGQQYFTVTVPPCDVILASPTSASFASTGGVGSVTVANYGGCAITVTTNSPWLSVTSSSGLGSGNGSFSYKVDTNSTIWVRVGQFIITDTEGSGNIVTQTVTITQQGIAAPPLGVITVDGTAESTYGCPIVVQTLGTGFGDNSSTNLQPVSGGSELDAAYGIIQNNVLFLTFAGNLEGGNVAGNYNEIEVFLMTGPGGASTLTNVNPSAVGGNAINALASQGFTFDGGFAPNYWIGANGGGSPYTLYFDFAQLWPGGTNGTGVATNGYYLGSTTSTNGTLLGGTNPFGIQATINNSNTNGVDGGPGGGVGCTTNYAGVAESTVAATVRTGIELGIPLAAIGSPTGTVYVLAFISGGGNHTYLSNQFIPPVATNDMVVVNCQANLGNTSVNLGTLAGGPHYFVIGPEMRVTGIVKSGGDINVSWQTAVSTNWSYQLQRTSTLTTSVWVNVGSSTNAGGGGVTQPDPNGATNRPSLFYRVKQTPLCP